MFAVYMIYNNISIGPLSPVYYVIIGLLLVALSCTPVKLHHPQVTIAKNIYRQSKQDFNDNRSRNNAIREIALAVLIGVILMIIEQNTNFRFIK